MPYPAPIARLEPVTESAALIALQSFKQRGLLERYRLGLPLEQPREIGSEV